MWHILPYAGFYDVRGVSYRFRGVGKRPRAGFAYVRGVFDRFEGMTPPLNLQRMSHPL